jgi:hypothetical protein
VSRSIYNTTSNTARTVGRYFGGRLIRIRWDHRSCTSLIQHCSCGQVPPRPRLCKLARRSCQQQQARPAPACRRAVGTYVLGVPARTRNVLRRPGLCCLHRHTSSSTGSGSLGGGLPTVQEACVDRRKCGLRKLKLGQIN